MLITVTIIFILGIVLIALEDYVKVNKAAIAILMCFALWGMISINALQIVDVQNNEEFLTYKEHALKESPNQSDHNLANSFILNHEFVPQLGDVSQTLFFIIFSLLVINVIDKYGGFRTIAKAVQINDKRKLLWRVAFLAFFFSSLLDNIAAAFVILSILRKIVPDKTDRLKYACITIIAANAGGSWSPIGDVTTLLLWMGGRISVLHQISHIFIPALVNMLVPVTIAHFWLFSKESQLRNESLLMLPEERNIEGIGEKSQKAILAIGILSLAIVPIFQQLSKLPPFLCVMLGLAVLWIFVGLKFGNLSKNQQESLKEIEITNIFKELDLPTIFFFLGILMSVGALKVCGNLSIASHFLDDTIKQPMLISWLIGVCSSFLDNVALVAGTMGMYPVQIHSANSYLNLFAMDGGFWTFLAYCSVTGGSILIIGSATGVSVMGLEKISFKYYFVRFSGLAVLGYIFGSAAYLLLFS